MLDKPVTLNDIAKKLHVSAVTVSKALRGHPDISVQMTKVIKSVAKEMGYTPNYMARNLSARKSQMIGVVVPKIAHFFFGAVIESIYNLAYDKNYEIILTVSQENEERERRHIQTLLSMQVDGIIISISQETQNYEIFETVRRRGVPIVFIDRIPPIQDINAVFVDDRGGAYKAVSHAIKLGYKKIAHFAGYSQINIGQERYLGFEQAMKDHNLEIVPEWVPRGGFGEKFGYDSFMDLYEKNKLPDLIFTVTYPVALGVYMAAREVGIKIPRDIDVICFGNAKVQNFLSPPLSCVDQPTEQIVERALDILYENIDNQENFITKSVQIDTELILRGTCINQKDQS